MNNVCILEGESQQPINPVLTFDYTPDHFQNHAFNSIHNGNDVLVLAPTGSGKTLVAKYAVAYAIRQLEKTCNIYNTGKSIVE